MTARAVYALRSHLFPVVRLTSADDRLLAAYLVAMLILWEAASRRPSSG